MLEKIGLPPKPSLRGNNWVIDASHCQQCSSQFSFINRKHHCRRCGGLFCNSCTQQRMMLRGQGDSPVRICDPCKKLEEAARFEMRYGHKNRAAKGGSKLALKKEDEASNGSSSNIPEMAVQAEGGEITRNLSLDQSMNTLTEAGSATPEDLREQAILEKKKYKTLKADGKSEEALKAFKRGKELEREAAALEISLRKNRRKALSSSNVGDTQQIKDDLMLSSGKSNLSAQKSKAKDDISAELKELGWSDMDLHDVEKKPTTLSLEGELSSLLREVSQKPKKEKGVITTDKSQVILHKKRALELKRAGNLVEAKEELKRAKIVERKIEEEELLGGDDNESDDELSSLIRSIDADDRDDLSAAYKSDLGFSFDPFVCGTDDLVVDGNFEVTEDDMDDPEIASALTSLGWTEDTRNDNLEDFKEQAAPSRNESLLSEIQSIKRKALTEKRAGNTAEAMALLKKAKALERELESSDIVQKGPVPQSSEDPLLYAGVNVENVSPTNYKGVKLAPKTKLTIQKELIALKKKALSLRREGRLAESEEELEKAKVLEQQLEDMNKASTVTQEITDKQQANNSKHVTLLDETQEEVTDQDMHDPAYLSLLKNMGWDDEDTLKVLSTISKDDHRTSTSDSSVTQHIETVTSRKSKSQIQRELLVLKRKALTLRREGEVEEAEEVLKMTRSLEAQLQEYEEPTQREEVSAENSEGNASTDAPEKTGSSLQVDLRDVGTGDSVNQDKIRLQTPEKMVRENEKPYIQEVISSDATVSRPISSTIQQEILAHKRKAVSLKREGKLAEAKEELRHAKLLEKRMEEEPSQTSSNSTDASASSSDKKEGSPSSVVKPISSRDRFKMQQQSLGHKRQALKLRREGRTAEADAEFELAKALESQLQELDSHDSTVSSKPVEDVSVEDFLDPQLLSALQALGIGESPTQTPNVERRESTKSHQDNIDNAEMDIEQLAERIKAEKVKAVNLKRAGKQAEALDSLRRAKLYEKKLQSLTSI